MKSEHLKAKVLFVSLLTCCLIFMGPLSTEAKDSIKIGVAGPLKYSWGKNMVAGAQVAADEINASGGVTVNGKKIKIEVISADSNDYQSIVDATNTLKRLITVDKVDYTMFGARTEAVLAQIEVMSEYKIISLLGGGGSPVVYTKIAENYAKYKYMFNALPNAADQTRFYLAMLHMAANKIRNELGIAKPKVALVMEKAKWTDSLAKAAEAILPKMGMEVVGLWKPSPTAVDVTAELSAIKAKGAHIIYQVFTGPAAVMVNKQVGELQLPVVVVGLNMIGAGMGKQYWDETSGMCAYETTGGSDFRNAQINKTSKPVFEKLFTKLGKTATLTGFTCYANVYILKEAIERANTLETEKVLIELEKTDWVGPQGRVAFYPKDHKWPHSAVFGPKFITFVGFQWRDGKMLAVWPDGVQSPLEKDPAWAGLKYKGTVDFELPPRMTKYWKK